MLTLAKPKKRAEKAVTTYRDGREVCNTKTRKGREEYHRRLVAMCRRQGWNCSECGKPMHQGDPPTYDHERPRGLGGGFRDDRIEVNGKPQNSAVHGLCNSLKGSRRGGKR